MKKLLSHLLILNILAVLLAHVAHLPQAITTKNWHVPLYV